MKNEKFKLAIASGKGGVGKSMLASALSMLFAKKKKVVAVDCDVDAPNLHLWLGQKEEWDKVKRISTNERPAIDHSRCNGCGKCVKICQFNALSFAKVPEVSTHYDPVSLATYDPVSSTSEVEGPRLRRGDTSEVILNPFFCEGCGACRVVCPKKAIKMRKVFNAEIRVKKNVFGFPLVFAQLYPGETGSGKIVEEIKRRAEKFKYELMILDSPAGAGCPVISTLKGSDFAILVTEPTPSGLSDLKRVLTVVDYFKIPFGVVINKWDINPKGTSRIEKELCDKILGKISYDKKIFEAIASFEPIIKTNLLVKKEIDLIKNAIEVLLS